MIMEQRVTIHEETEMYLNYYEYNTHLYGVYLYQRQLESSVRLFMSMCVHI